MLQTADQAGSEREPRYKAISVPVRAHPLMRAVFIELVVRRLNYHWLSRQSGVSVRQLRKLRLGWLPTLANTIAIYNALGLELTVKRTVALPVVMSDNGQSLNE